MPIPENTVAPAVIGTEEVGYQLECSTGEWSGSVDSYAFQWQRVGNNTENIAGATGSIYVITADDCGYSLQCIVTATNESGSASETSNQTGVIPDDWFVVEDGTGKADAIAYCSIADADTYHAQRSHQAWNALTCGQKKAALVKATDYIEQAFLGRWKGVLLKSDQALQWPRAEVLKEDDYYKIYYPQDEIPVALKQATALLALKSIEGDLMPDLTQGVRREKVDVLEVEYDTASPQYTRYRAVDNMLAHLMDSSGAAKKVARV